jgi:hypothetical protein
LPCGVAPLAHQPHCGDGGGAGMTLSLCGGMLLRSQKVKSESFGKGSPSSNQLLYKSPQNSNPNLKKEVNLRLSVNTSQEPF